MGPVGFEPTTPALPQTKGEVGGVGPVGFEPTTPALPQTKGEVGGVGPVGFEPTTKGFTCPGVSAGSGLSLHPRMRTCVWVRDALACHQGRSSPQVVSAPSAGVPAARLRVAMGTRPRRFP